MAPLSNGYGTAAILPCFLLLSKGIAWALKFTHCNNAALLFLPLSHACELESGHHRRCYFFPGSFWEKSIKRRKIRLKDQSQHLEKNHIQLEKHCHNYQRQAMDCLPTVARELNTYRRQGYRVLPQVPGVFNLKKTKQCNKSLLIIMAEDSPSPPPLYFS